MTNYIKEVRIGISSPEEIIERSNGEVTKPATISYKNQMPEEDGLFCQKIFGPIKDFECACKKYRQPKDRGKTCENCGVQATRTRVRRDRFGHIKLACPVSHIWMLKSLPSKIANYLNLKAKSVEEIVYFVSYVVIDPGKTTLKKFSVIDQNNGRKIFTKQLLEIQKNVEKEIIMPDLKGEDREFIYGQIDFYLTELKDTGYNYSFEDILDFIYEIAEAKIDTGASAVKELILSIDLDKEIRHVKNNIRKEKSLDKELKRLRILESFKTSGNKPEWMIMDVLPVLPPDLRPIIQLNTNKYTSSEINELYRRVIIRNERLKQILKKSPAKIIENNEKRLLQEAVDALIDNQRRSRPSVGKDRRVLKSLTDSLKGKRGRFRQNLLGKRVDYSGRSVIVVGPDLKMYECGIPRKIAIELFKPFLIHEIMKDLDEEFYTPKMVEKMINNQEKNIWPYLETVIKKRPVLLNRAPTLHRMGIQAFEVKLVKGKAIQLHPLVTTAFNADFDGDHMACHLPLSDTAIAEARSLMIGSRNIIGLKDGKPIASPTQDMILGIYYLTQETSFNPKNPIQIFNDLKSVRVAFESKIIKLHEYILISIDGMIKKGFLDRQKSCFLITTTGKAVLNDILSDEIYYFNNRKMKYISPDRIVTFNPDKDNVGKYFKNREQLNKYLLTLEENKPFNSGSLSKMVIEIYKKYGRQSGKYLDYVKDLGFKYSTISGITVSASDIQFKDKDAKEENPINNFKDKKIKKAREQVNQISEFYEDGMLTKNDRHQRIINEWSDVKNDVENFLKDYLEKDNIKINPMYKISDSGARGNISNFVQLSGMRGLMVSPKGDIIEVPIESSFKEGLSMIEFFISTHGARKGMADTALKTADSGYLTRRLVDAAQDLIIDMYDCKTLFGLNVKKVTDLKTNTVIVPLRDRIVGRVSLNDIRDNTDEIIVKKQQIITERDAKQIDLAKIENVLIRSVLRCNSKLGICAVCFGVDFSKNEIVKVGSAVGIISAQSIGEPCTQLTMRTFHTGGVAGSKDITQGLPRIKELLDVVKPKGRVAIISEINGHVTDIVELNNGQKIVTILGKYVDLNKQEQEEVCEYKISYEDRLRIKKGDVVKIGGKITEGSVDLKHYLEITDVFMIQKYILKEIQRVYRIQGIEISEKYIEVILKKMLQKVQIQRQGDTKFSIGSYVDINDFKEVNRKLLIANKRPAFGNIAILGLKKVPLESKSFLSAASFQDTTKILVNSAVAGKVDYLISLKENVLLGKLIPAGTGLESEELIISNGIKAKEEQY